MRLIAGISISIATMVIFVLGILLISGKLMYVLPWLRSF